MSLIDRQDNFKQFERLYWQLSREMGYQWKKIYDDTFPGSQSHILFLLERKGPQKMSELAEILHLTPGAVTTASDRLIDQGYIARIGDETDRRVIRLEMTHKGKEKLKELQGQGRKIMKLIFNDISNEDLAKMNTIFKRATLNIEKVGEEYTE